MNMTVGPGPAPARLVPVAHNELMRVVVTRIERDGTMHRRMVDTAQQGNPRAWEVLIARALAVRPPYRPVPGTDIYHICLDDDTVQVGEYELEGPLRDLVTVILAIGSTMLAGRGTACPPGAHRARCSGGVRHGRR